MDSKPITARVPSDIAEMFEKACKQKRLTKSKAIAQMIATFNLPIKEIAKGETLKEPEEPQYSPEFNGFEAIEISPFDKENKWIKTETRFTFMFGLISFFRTSK